ncbi:FIST C-terminal domain-containing protein [Methylobacillus gramineus]|uniref:FIST C-terminal domain-containing protein n=1 Tax=Methylobacillus gramineus TaxID=755169 RepID=UPI001CFF9BA6|nr:FIST C-terminal domain-containing protein [Methylobacillus gramineus]MCB5184810.1 FIST C-terminal domain-containing protein [Methylobacillus gramineus]
MKVGTGFVRGRQAVPELAAEAVKLALDAAGLQIASSVLLFLTEDFADNPLPAIRAAAAAASTTQVVGCSATGIFTDQDWALDVPAVAVLVLGEGASLQYMAAPNQAQWLLTLTAPNAVNTTWLQLPGMRFGGVSGDVTGQGPFSVWENGKGTVRGYCEVALQGVTGSVAAAHGLKLLTKPQQVSTASGHDVKALAGKPALAGLQQAHEADASIEGQGLPYHKLMAVFANSREQLELGDYTMASLISGNLAEQSVTVSKQVAAGQWLAWGLRDTEAAQDNLSEQIEAISASLPGSPVFGLLFSCMGRGPYFYGGIDRDIELLKQYYPAMPFIGFYGNGEIAPMFGRNELLQYSVVLGLFANEGQT